jgi:hypothetical protein
MDVGWRGEKRAIMLRTASRQSDGVGRNGVVRQ